MKTLKKLIFSRFFRFQTTDASCFALYFLIFYYPVGR